MTIDQHKTINQIQQDFTGLFPYLKIEFFKKAHNTFGGNSNKEIIHSNEVITITSIGELHITSSMTVNELEQLFKSQFGLNIQVFRKHGKTWIETTVTDNWTLFKQNEEGKTLSELKF
jgi:hypothetical protein